MSDPGQGALGFVIWDMSITGLRSQLQVLERRGFDVPGLQDVGGSIAANVLEEGIDRAEKVLVFLDRPNVNVGFEVGYAYGRNKPVALLYSAVERPNWLRDAPFATFFSHAVSGPDSVQNLPESAYVRVPGWTPAGSRTLLLCPATGEGAAFRTVFEQRSELQTLELGGWNLNGLSTKLVAVSRVVWVISPPRRGEERDGEENARNAVVAGYAHARGAELKVLISSEMRELADLEGMAHRFVGLDGLEEKMAPFLREPTSRSWLAPNEEKGADSGEIDFSPLVRRGIRDFVGREWLVKQVDRFLGENDHGYVRIEAFPGMGKSAFAAHLVSTRSWLHHFVTREGGVVSYADCVRNLRGQLARRIGMEFEHPTESDLSHGLYLNQLLEETGRNAVKTGHRLVILIDGVDEAEPVRAGASPLYLPSYLPSGVRVVVLGRQKALQALRMDPPFENLVIDPNLPENRGDVELFLTRMARGSLAPILDSAGVPTGDFIKRVLDASEGNFMYVRSLVDELLQPDQELGDLKGLPRGLTGYFERQWIRLQEDVSVRDWEQVYLPPLRILSVATQPYDVAELVEVLNAAPGQGANQITETQMRRILQRWSQFLLAEPGKNGLRYRIYHWSFQEFLAGKEEVGGTEAREEANAWIGLQGLKKYGVQP